MNAANMTRKEIRNLADRVLVAIHRTRAAGKSTTVLGTGLASIYLVTSDDARFYTADATARHHAYINAAVASIDA
jgi:hypothetical protein